MPIDPARTAEGKKLLDVAVGAKGGLAKLRGMHDVADLGKVQLSTQGQIVTGEWKRIFVAPDKLRVDMVVPSLAVTVTLAVSPLSVWQSVAGHLIELHGDEAAIARGDLWRDRDLIVTRHLEPGTVVQSQGKQTIDGKDYDVVMIRKPDGASETQIFLDPATHLMARMVYEKNGSKGIEQYSDYRAVEGIQFAFRQKTEVASQSFDVTITDIKLNGGADAHAFDPPKP